MMNPDSTKKMSTPKARLLFGRLTGEPPVTAARFSVSWKLCSTTIENAASARNICKLSSLADAGARGETMRAEGEAMRALSGIGGRRIGRDIPRFR